MRVIYDEADGGWKPAGQIMEVAALLGTRDFTPSYALLATYGVIPAPLCCTLSWRQVVVTREDVVKSGRGRGGCCGGQRVVKALCGGRVLWRCAVPRVF